MWSDIFSLSFFCEKKLINQVVTNQHFINSSVNFDYVCERSHNLVVELEGWDEEVERGVLFGGDDSFVVVYNTDLVEVSREDVPMFSSFGMVDERRFQNWIGYFFWFERNW